MKKRQLLQKVISESANYDVITINLHVDPLNITAIKLYTKFGFKIIKTEKDYFGENKDRHIMQDKL